MIPALSAKLLEFEAIRRFLFVLCGDIIPVLALGALKRDVVSWHNSLPIYYCYFPFAIHYFWK